MTDKPAESAVERWTRLRNGRLPKTNEAARRLAHAGDAALAELKAEWDHERLLKDVAVDNNRVYCEEIRALKEALDAERIKALKWEHVARVMEEECEMSADTLYGFAPDRKQEP